MPQTTHYNWIISIPATTVIEPLDSIYSLAEQDLLASLQKSGRRYYLRRYGISSSKGSKGSARNTLRLADNMVKSAHQLYRDLCTCKKSLDNVHFIAAQLGVGFAVKFIGFFHHFGYTLHRNSGEDFDQRWNDFLSSPAHGEPLYPSPHFRSLIAVDPSLPNLGFFARLLRTAPDIYSFKRVNLTTKVDISYSIKIDGLAVTNHCIIIEGPDTKYITLSGNVKEMDVIFAREFSSLQDKSEDEQAPTNDYDSLHSSETATRLIPHISDPTEGLW